MQAALEQRLPEDQAYLAGPLAAGATQVADRAAERLLERPRIQALWIESLVIAQRQLERVLDDDLTAVQTEGGYVVLNLRPLVIQLGDEVAIVGNLASRLPPDAGRIQLMKADQLETAQDLTQLFKSVAAWIWVVPFVLWALALWLARGRRRRELRAVAWAIIAAGVLVLVGRSVGGRYVVDALSGTAATRGSVARLVGHHHAALAGRCLVRDPARRRRSRRRVARRTEGLGPGFAAALRPSSRAGVRLRDHAALLLLLVWWGPTAQTRRCCSSPSALCSSPLGVEALRRIARRDFPGRDRSSLSTLCADCSTRG